MNDQPIKHLYVFDDLTHHVRRLASARMSEARTADVLREVGRLLNRAFAGFDHARQDHTLSTWDGAAIQLAWELADRDARFDLLVSQGCNGDYAAQTLLEVFEREHARALTATAANVRVTHILDDPANAFYSDFKIGVSKGDPLDVQCRAALDEGTRDGTPPRRIAVVDDCIQTGRGTLAVVEGLLALQPDAEVWTLGFIACQATQDRFRARGWRPVQGVLLRGETYPASWETDIYFTKDWILDNAIRFADGTQHAYIEDPAWMASIFAGDPEGATAALRELREVLSAHGLYDELLAL